MKPTLRFAVYASTSSPMPRRLFLLMPVLFLAGCIHVKMDPIQVHATVDVNVKIDQALDDFFGDIDRKSTTMKVETK
jgi:hypothetical protein